jgi:glycosyltransferase involved in cell wall biosynthesis
LNGIITSTSGSCPIKGPKVHAIGQAIDEKQFAIVGNQPKNPALSWYHVGRLDESKNIHIIIAVFKALRQFGWQLSLDFYGEPSKGISESYFKSLLPYFESSEYASWLRCHGTIKRSKISEVAKNYDGFVHAFEGSLDKALLEAVMCRRVVVSINSEFLRDFESGKKCDVKVYDALMKQMLLTLNLSTIAQLNLLDRYWEIAKAHHSLDGWIERVTKVLSVQ